MLPLLPRLLYPCATHTGIASGLLVSEVWISAGLLSPVGAEELTNGWESTSMSQARVLALNFPLSSASILFSFLLPPFDKKSPHISSCQFAHLENRNAA